MPALLVLVITLQLLSQKFQQWACTPGQMISRNACFGLPFYSGQFLALPSFVFLPCLIVTEEALLPLNSLVLNPVSVSIPSLQNRKKEKVKKRENNSWFREFFGQDLSPEYVQSFMPP